MSLEPTQWIWMNGRLVPWDEARIHVLSHVVHYGSAVFEGIRCYETARGPAVFRLRDHVDRLVRSARIYRMEIPYVPAELERACLDAVRANGLPACYIRPVVFRGYGEVGVNPLGCPVETAVAVWRWGAYLGHGTQEAGVEAQVSSWTRIAPNTLPAMAKAAANYANSQLIKMEALVNGYAEGIALDAQGYVSEGSGENLFLVRGGILFTPPVAGSILPGVTRSTVLTLAGELGIPVREERIPREGLYVADEAFFTGTAAEITPIKSVDRIRIGPDCPGAVTLSLSEAFHRAVRGEPSDRHGWLTPVGSPVSPPLAGRPDR